MNAKRYRITLVGIIVLVIITSLIAIYYYSNKNNSEQARTNSVEYKYYLKEYNNQIGVYKTNEDKPFRTIDVYVFTLPSVDQQELKTGIMVQDDDKLRMIIEDYES